MHLLGGSRTHWRDGSRSPTVPARGVHGSTPRVGGTLLAGLAMAGLKTGWKPSDVPPQVPESVRRALQDQQPTTPPGGSGEERSAPRGLNDGWEAADIPSQVPESVRHMLAQEHPPTVAASSKVPAQPESPGQPEKAPNGDLCELLIVGGTIVDGTGAEPWVGDLAILDGVISAMAPSLSHMRALRTVDATGHIVTPGFVDIHTHYVSLENVVLFTYILYPRQHGVSSSLAALEPRQHHLSIVDACAAHTGWTNHLGPISLA